MKKYVIVVICSLLFFTVEAQYNCELDSKPFQNNELLKYNVFYKWGFVNLNAGEVAFSITEEQKFNKPVYHLKGVGNTYENYDWIYKVRDYYNSWVDTADLSPNLFSREANEGGHQYANYYTFDREKDSIFAKSIVEEKIAYDTLAYEKCLFDVISLVYYCRTLDFSEFIENQKIPLTLVLDGKQTEMFIRYLGKEQQELENGKTFNTIKFSALLIEGSMFKGGEEMYVWITDDANRIPVRVQAEIWIGSVNANIKEYTGLKYPVMSEVK